jgi:type VI secretion system protein ImpH
VSEALVAQLLARPQRVGFYRAVELLERSNPHAVRVGELGPVLKEVVRFRHDPSLTFSTSDVRGILRRERSVEEAVDGAALEDRHQHLAPGLRRGHA